MSQKKESCLVKPKKEKKKKRKRKTKQLSHPQLKKSKKKKRKEKNWTNCPCVSAHGYFCLLSSPIFFLRFYLHLERKLFSGPGEKTPKPHHLFLFLLIQLNTLQKSFPSHFFSKVFHPPYFTFKQTHL